jgi:hypothetical protein
MAASGTVAKTAEESIANRIYKIRNQNVMIDRDLAE